MPNPLHQIAKEIDDAITLEIAATPKQFVYAIQEVRLVADVVSVKVDLDNSKSSGLDESLEGAAAWWPGPPRGFADVLSVDPENERVNLRYVTPQPPALTDTLFIYPPLYLEALRDWWRLRINAEQAIRWLDRVKDQNRFDPGLPLVCNRFPWLREEQRKAFQLPAWDCGFLEGPPGTGKTTTLGTVLATYLEKHPGNRVLLLSTTNTAVDQALVAVDKQLEQFPNSGWPLRRQCKRLGHHFVASHYEGRSHLLPSPDPELVKQLAELESKRPDPQDLVAYSSWKGNVDQLRARLKTNLSVVLRGARLGAMTTCAAMFWTSLLHEVGAFDLIVFDEASQVGLAYAMALATFGKRCLFAGDPKQLAPIVQSQYRQPAKWLGRSTFDAISRPADDPSPFVFLNEQSRMHSQICEVVSHLFYGGRLTVARDAQNDPDWHRYRTLSNVNSELRQSVLVLPSKPSHQWSQKYHGPIRFESTQIILDLIKKLLMYEDPKSILVLTPFRAQRTLLRSVLRQECRGVTVSTVHRAQGSERRTVIFDPVDGTSNFLLGDEARRLINVALSRAKARLVLVLSSSDRENPLFQHPRFAHGTDSVPAAGQLPSGANRMHPVSRPAIEPIASYVSRQDFPRCILGKHVSYRGFEGLVTSVSNGVITLENAQGETQIYHATFLRSMLLRR